MARWRGESLNLLCVCILRSAFNTLYYDLCVYLFTRWQVYMHEDTHCCQIQKSIKTNKLAWNENTNVGLFEKSRTSVNAPETLMKWSSDHSYALLLSSDDTLAATWVTFIFSQKVASSFLIHSFVFCPFFKIYVCVSCCFSNTHLPPLFLSHCLLFPPLFCYPISLIYLSLVYPSVSLPLYSSLVAYFYLLHLSLPFISIAIYFSFYSYALHLLYFFDLLLSHVFFFFFFLRYSLAFNVFSFTILSLFLIYLSFGQ